jgi:hypothetical protein
MNSIELTRSIHDGQWALAYVASIGHYLDGPALLVMDTNPPSLSWYEKLASLMREANPPRRSKVLIIGDHEQRQLWENVAHRSAGDLVLDVVPPLTFEQSLGHIEFCVEVERTTVAPGLLVTPDAALLLAHCAEGNLGQLNRVLQAAIEQARADHASVLNSWHAWGAQPDELDASSDLSDRITRPESWPSKAVLDILNHYRCSFGIPPRR